VAGAVAFLAMAMLVIGAVVVVTSLRARGADPSHDEGH
jgi:hypothetical protein